ncbi:MAG: hypothetical protein NT040_02910 [Bacteroidetes bacterium]|nr:hypothetical protein [Bacteroidota bacterium]
MDHSEKVTAQSETESVKSKRGKNILALCMTLSAAIAGFTSGHLGTIPGVIIFSLSIISVGVILYLYYWKSN